MTARALHYAADALWRVLSESLQFSVDAYGIDANARIIVRDGQADAMHLNK